MSLETETEVEVLLSCGPFKNLWGNLDFRFPNKDQTLFLFLWYHPYPFKLEKNVFETETHSPKYPFTMLEQYSKNSNKSGSEFAAQNNLLVQVQLGHAPGSHHGIHVGPAHQDFSELWDMLIVIQLG